MKLSSIVKNWFAQKPYVYGYTVSMDGSGKPEELRVRLVKRSGELEVTNHYEYESRTAVWTTMDPAWKVCFIPYKEMPYSSLVTLLSWYFANCSPVLGYQAYALAQQMGLCEDGRSITFYGSLHQRINGSSSECVTNCILHLPNKRVKCG
jgi:hypothetical protein